MKPIHFFAVAVLVLYASCDQKTVVPSAAYFPLEVGNYWELTSTDWSKGDPSEYMTLEITGRLAVGPVLYYKTITHRINKTTNVTDTIYYRLDTDGYVYAIGNYRDVTEDNPLRINAALDEQWSYTPGNPTGVEVKALGLTKAQGSGNILDNAKGFVYDVPSVPNDERYLYLAPGIGFAVERTAAGDYKQLKRAIVGGKVYSY